MSRIPRRQVIIIVVGVLLIAGVALITRTKRADYEPIKPYPIFDPSLPKRLTKEDIRATKNDTFTKLEFAGSTFWVSRVNLGYGVPHTLIGVYAQEKDGSFHLCLSAESWAAGSIEATVDIKTGILEIRERANSKLNGQLVLSCNLRTVGTQHSIREK